mmetsp:Transcript_39260/g.65158  ORF Transcript_39260/g.65158 Transcript_39260/m.65158 type:complete len:346 (+) Transcript_39260:83-1120(+)
MSVIRTLITGRGVIRTLQSVTRQPSSMLNEVSVADNATGPTLRVGAARPPTAAARGWLYETELLYSCASLFESHSQASAWPPLSWDALSDLQRMQLTLGGAVHVIKRHIVEHANGGQSNEWHALDIAALALNATRGQCFSHYGEQAGQELCKLLHRYKGQVRGKHVLVLGSQTPWLEAALLAFGASAITTVEYQPTRCLGGGLCASIKVMSPSAVTYTKKKRGMFEVAFSFSSLEHDGLGRYGDPIRPYADLETVQKVHCMLRPGGMLFLALPINLGRDLLLFNAHRVYGPLRLPLLTANFDLLETVGQITDTRLAMTNPFQPWLVLRAFARGQQHKYSRTTAYQ